MSCPQCGEPTRLRTSGLLVHEDRTLDASHLPIVRQPGDPRTEEELEAREHEILGILQGAGLEELTPSAVAGILGPGIRAAADFEETRAKVDATMTADPDPIEAAFRAAGYTGDEHKALEERRLDGDR